MSKEAVQAYSILFVEKKMHLSGYSMVRWSFSVQKNRRTLTLYRSHIVTLPFFLYCLCRKLFSYGCDFSKSCSIIFPQHYLQLYQVS